MGKSGRPKGVQRWSRYVNRLLEPAILLCAGLALLVFSLTGGAATTAHRTAPALAWHQLAFLYGVTAACLSGLSYLLAQHQLTVWGCISDSIRAARVRAGHSRPIGPPDRIDTGTLVLLAASMVTGVAARWAFIDQPMRLDESNTFLAFVQNSWSHVFLYPFPNNHVLNSIFERLSTAVLGDDPRAIRMPAFLFGVANIAVAYALGRRLSGAMAATLAAFGVACWPYLIFFSTNGRGYSQLMFFSLLIPYVLLDANGHLAPSRVAIAALLAALGMATMPSMVFVLAGLVLWMFLVPCCQSLGQSRIWIQLLLPFSIMTLLLTLIFYTPVALVSGGLQGALASKEAIALPLKLFAQQAGHHLLVAASTLTVDVPSVAIYLLIALNILASVMFARERRHAAALLFPCILVGALGLFALKRSIPFPRTWIFLVPFALIGAGLGWNRLCAYLSVRLRYGITVLLCLAAVALAARLAQDRAVEDYWETGKAPDAEGLVRVVVPRMKRGDIVCAVPPTNLIVAYYLWRDLRPSAIAEGGQPGRVLWLRDITKRPSRGLDQGWRTIGQSGRMSVDEWSLPGVPTLVESGQIDCWRPDADTRLR